MELKFKKTCGNLTVYIYGELDECSASNVKIILDKLIYDNTDARNVTFDLSGL